MTGDSIPDAKLEAFRAEARAWLAANFPTSLKGRGALMTAEDPPSGNRDFQAWKRAMGEKGWGVPNWPAALGGGGLDAARARVLGEEMSAIGAWSPIGGMGVMMFGPTLLEYGDEAQKARHIPPIARGEVRWCQGFSEPGAGSDLAGLSTRCEDKGDHWLVNGQKVWTSGANHADWCFCLVRTDPVRKHEGISFLLIDMRSSGVEVRPIRLISGNSPFCETFFTDVKVAKEDLVGPLGGGWSIAKRLLQHERNGLGGGRGGAAAPLAAMARDYVGEGPGGRIADADLRIRIAAHEMEARAFQLTALRSMGEARSNQASGAVSSIMKNAGTKIAQDRLELVVEIMGSQGLGWQGEAYKPGELAAVRAWLGSKAYSIYGGSAEIQNNIIAKRILGLPDPLAAASH
ncbi:MAG: acyl-CoA dehydrogenase family protein [Pseudomonadota bacterium]|nr:acyl-CoA dehydrogenase family protein [Pseudomonadota bacterium]